MRVLMVNLEEGRGARVEWDCLGRMEGDILFPWEMEVQMKGRGWM
jgi:hypothetical protein